MPKIAEDTIKEVIQLNQTGISALDIAEKIGWPRNEYSRKKIGKILKGVAPTQAIQKSQELELTLDQMTRDQRFEYLKENVTKTPRARLVFNTFTAAEKEFFLDEYLKILRATDSISEPEEQSLFSACVEYVLAFRALDLKSIEEKCYAETQAGKWKQGDIRFRAFVDDKFAKQYQQHLETYRKLVTDLKMSRSQRLDKIKNEKRTLVDLAVELSSKSAQTIATDDIIRLSRLTDEELKKMIDNGYVMGIFEEKGI